jgi:glutamate synthase domain-containing protein 3
MVEVKNHVAAKIAPEVEVGAGVKEISALDARGEPKAYRPLNEEIHRAAAEGYDVIRVYDVHGQRYLAAGLEGGVRLEVHGTAGNDLGIFMDGPTVEVFGSAQDQAGNTMNGGKIVVHGNAWDVTGLAARGGTIFVRGDGGYRIGIHMKEFRRHRPVVVYGGRVCEFFGEYMAGGVLVALGLDLRPGAEGSGGDGRPVAGPSLGTGIHGGAIYLRGDVPDHYLGVGAVKKEFEERDRGALEPVLREFCGHFGVPLEALWEKPFTKIAPASSRPYKAYYCGKLI